jgi:succinyl-CoA synthetase beta subunit/citryl-CoA synthetase large subunit
MTLAEINPLAELEDGSFVALDAHMEMENEASAARSAAAQSSGSPRTTPARPTSRALRAQRQGDRRRRPPRRDPGQGHGFHGNLGLVIGAGGGSLTLTDAVRSQGGKPANYSEIGGNPRSPRPAAWPSRCCRRTASRRSR